MKDLLIQCHTLGYILEDHVNGTRRKRQPKYVRDQTTEFLQHFLPNLHDLYFVTQAVQRAENVTFFFHRLLLANRIGYD